jgi:hypothetical protein
MRSEFFKREGLGLPKIDRPWLVEKHVILRGGARSSEVGLQEQDFQETESQVMLLESLLPLAPSPVPGRGGRLANTQ